MTAPGVKVKITLQILSENYTFKENVIKSFEWRSMVNSGFMVKVTVIDSHFSILTNILDSDSGGYPYLLQNARMKPTPIRFKIGSDTGRSPIPETPWRTAIMADIDAKGYSTYGEFSFIAVDPVTYYLNWGDASGGSYYGKIGGNNGVIQQIINEYVPTTIKGVAGDIPVNVNVDDTTDQPARYWQMRQDPKTLIQSLLEWSSPFTKNKTSWIVSTGEDTSRIDLNIRESYTPQLNPPSSIPAEGGSGELLYNLDNKINEWRFYADHMLSTYNNKLVTAGLSAVTGEYFDTVSDPKEQYVFATDNNTPNKLRPPIRADRGFTKPRNTPPYSLRGWSYVHSLPETSGGDPHLWYRDYISGRARQKYMEMLNMVMRIRISTLGEPRLYSSDDLNRCKIVLQWVDLKENKPHIFSGPWLLYGWHHKYKLSSGGVWYTDTYLSRLDWDAVGLPNGGS